MMVTKKNILGKRDEWKEEDFSPENLNLFFFSCQKRVYRIVDLCNFFLKKNKINLAKKILFQK